MTIADQIEVVIVGGGAAGIAACRRLRDAGIGCLLIEARERLGGRAWTVRSPETGEPLDLGCGWLHSADRNPLRAMFAAEGRAIDETPPPWTRGSLPFGFPPPEQAAFGEAMGAFHERLYDAAQLQPDAAASALLEPGNRWNGLIGAVSTYISGAEPERLSIRDLGRYADSGVNHRVVDGYGAAIAALGGGLSVVLGCPVTRIDHNGRRLKVETGRGVVTADVAIVTLPTALLADARSLFDPPLPEKAEAAVGLPLGPADKLFLALDGAEAFDKDSRLFGRTDRTGTGAYHFRPFGRPLIEAYYAGSLAAALEAGGEGAFFDFAVTEFSALLGSDFARQVKPLAHHAWKADPFARGSYSYALPGKADCRAALAAPVDDRLFFAGEACSPQDFSTAHGAWQSGVAAAEAVIAAKGRR